MDNKNKSRTRGQRSLIIGGKWCPITQDKIGEERTGVKKVDITGIQDLNLIPKREIVDSDKTEGSVSISLSMFGKSPDGKSKQMAEALLELQQLFERTTVKGKRGQNNPAAKSVLFADAIVSYLYIVKNMAEIKKSMYEMATTEVLNNLNLLAEQEGADS